MTEKRYRLEEKIVGEWTPHSRVTYEMDLATAVRTLGEMRGIAPSKEYRLVEVTEENRYDDIPF
jgi:plasmid stabilization system protein ParE